MPLYGRTARRCLNHSFCGGITMAMETGGLEALIVQTMEAGGFKTTGEHAYAGKLARALAEAIVPYIKANAEVVVSGGSSSGTYKVS